MSRDAKGRVTSAQNCAPSVPRIAPFLQSGHLRATNNTDLQTAARKVRVVPGLHFYKISGKRPGLVIRVPTIAVVRDKSGAFHSGGGKGCSKLAVCIPGGKDLER